MAATTPVGNAWASGRAYRDPNKPSGVPSPGGVPAPGASVNDFYKNTLGANWQSMMAPTVAGNASAGYGEREENLKGALAAKFKEKYGADPTVAMSYDPLSGDPAQSTKRMMDYFKAAESGQGKVVGGKFYTQQQIDKYGMPKGAVGTLGAQANQAQPQAQPAQAQTQAAPQAAQAQPAQPQTQQAYNPWGGSNNPWGGMMGGIMQAMQGYGQRQDIFGGGGYGPQMSSLQSLLQNAFGGQQGGGNSPYGNVSNVYGGQQQMTREAQPYNNFGGNQYGGGYMGRMGGGIQGFYQ